MRNAKVGSFTLTEEDGFLKVEHNNGELSFRIAAGDIYLEDLFTHIEESEVKDGYELTLASIALFTRMALQDFVFVADFVRWYGARAVEPKEVSEEEDARILKDQELLYQLEKDAEREPTADGAEQDDTGL